MKGLIIISVVFVGWLALDLLLLAICKRPWRNLCDRWDRDYPTLDDRRHW